MARKTRLLPAMLTRRTPILPKWILPAWRALPALAVILVAGPAIAQFGSIFAPPRPPADVPYPQYPSDPRALPQPRYDPRDERRPEPPPPPLTRLPPRTAPPAGGVQTQPLPPPPGATPSPQQQPAQPTQEQAARPPVTGPGQPPLVGLPPGQRQPRGTPQQGTRSDEVVVAPPKEKIVNPTAVFAGLDKITGRIISFDVAIGETVQFGALRLTPRACYTRPPTEPPNTDGFTEIDEITLQGEVKRIFTGWMFASSPGLHAVEHPIYDVWLTDCKGNQEVAGSEEKEQPAAQPASAPAAPPRPPQRPAQRQQSAPVQNAPAQPAPLRR